MTPEQEADARRLIDAALGTGDQVGDALQRADESAAAFTDAANAYARDEMTPAGDALDHYLDSVDNLAQGAYDLCAAGAIRVAGLFADQSPQCGHEVYATSGLAMLGDADPFMSAALDLINAAAAQRADDLGGRLMAIYHAHGARGLHFLAFMLVHLYREVRELVNSEQ